MVTMDAATGRAVARMKTKITREGDLREKYIDNDEYCLFWISKVVTHATLEYSPVYEMLTSVSARLLRRESIFLALVDSELT